MGPRATYRASPSCCLFTRSDGQLNVPQRGETCADPGRQVLRRRRGLLQRGAEDLARLFSHGAVAGNRAQPQPALERIVQVPDRPSERRRQNEMPVTSRYNCGRFIP